MPRRTAAALALAGSLLAFTRAAADPAVIADVPAPKSYAAVPWKHGDLVTAGYWYSAPQVQKIDARIRYLEERAAKECVDAQIDAARRTATWLYVAGGVLAGAAIGYCAGSSGHCGIGR